MPSNNDAKTKITITITLFLTILFLAMSCKECPTEPKYDIYLSVEDVACIWVTLKVTLPDSGRVNTFALERNDSAVAIYTCFDDDTLIFDEGLSPDTEYSYRVRFLKDGKTKAESEPITVHTLPTTSHDFTWEIDTLGNYGSYLKDAWIVDENNIWVVGNIETDSGTFNAAKWDGEKWETIKVLSGYSPNYSIWYFNENDIWVCSGFPIHWDGEVWTLYHLQNMGLQVSIEHIWASSPDDIYFVGRKGSIVHYDGSDFTKLQSPNDTKLLAVSGNRDGSYVFAAGYDVIVPTKTTALMIHNGTVNEMYYSDYLIPQSSADYGSISALDVCDNTVYFVTYKGLWKYNFKNGLSIIDYSVKSRHFHTEVVQNSCDIFIAGGGFRYVHFNGETWEIYDAIYDQYNFATYSADFKGDVAVIVGYVQGGSHGIVAIGRR